MARPESEFVCDGVMLVDDPAARPGELDGATHDGGEHGLKIERGADSPPDLPKRRELSYRPDQFLRPGLELTKESSVFDRDGRLVGERLHQRDMAVGERSHLMPVDL